MSKNENVVVEKGKENFFKKAWNATKNFSKKAWNATANFCKNAWAKFKAIPWSQPVKPVVAWSIIGGVLVVSVALMLIFWL